MELLPEKRQAACVHRPALLAERRLIGGLKLNYPKPWVHHHGKLSKGARDGKTGSRVNGLRPKLVLSCRNSDGDGVVELYPRSGRWKRRFPDGTK